MSKYIITIDVGNTNISVIVFDATNANILEKKKYRTEDVKKGTLYKDFLDFKDKYVVGCAYISSVVPKANKKISEALEELDIKPTFINPLDYQDIMQLDVRGKEELGSDIFCGCVESLKYAPSTITIDMGTAITIALVKDSKFYACAIFPGTYLSFSSLSNNTALLDQVKLEEPKNMFQGDTTDALQTGMIFGISGAIREIVNKYLEVASDAKVIFTGGDGIRYVKYFQNALYEANLIHLGLLDIYIRRNGIQK